MVYRGICASEESIKTHIMPIVEPMAKAYLDLYHSALEMREFFGLRDFYRFLSTSVICVYEYVASKL